MIGLGFLLGFCFCLLFSGDIVTCEMGSFQESYLHHVPRIMAGPMTPSQISQIVFVSIKESFKVSSSVRSWFMADLYNTLGLLYP